MSHNWLQNLKNILIKTCFSNNKARATSNMFGLSYHSKLQIQSAISQLYIHDSEKLMEFPKKLFLRFGWFIFRTLFIYHKNVAVAFQFANVNALPDIYYFVQSVKILICSLRPSFQKRCYFL